MSLVHRFRLGLTLSNALRIGNGPFVSRTTGVECPSGFEEEYMDFFLGDGSMLYTSRNDQELTFLKPNVSVTVLHAESTLDNEKQLILQIVMMPDKLALKLDELDMLTVQLADNLGVPVFVESRQLFGEIDFFHDEPLNSIPRAAMTRINSVSVMTWWASECVSPTLVIGIRETSVEAIASPSRPSQPS